MKQISLICDRAGRLDAVASPLADVTRSRMEKLIREGQVEVNGNTETKPSRSVEIGDSVRVLLPDPAPTHLEAQEIPLNILYQDKDLAVVYKPSGMTVHPGAGTPDGTMANALLCALDGVSHVGGVERPGIVHRIDKDTSGLLLVAKNDRTHLALSEQIGAHTVDRAYLALCYGRFSQEEGEIEGPIGRSPSDRKKMAIVAGGKPALTRYRVLEQYDKCALVKCVLSTGRTHQIRVHMTSRGHPLLGDPVYGPKKPIYDVEGGQLLHAFMIGFTHPGTGERMRFEAPPEERFIKWVYKLRGGREKSADIPGMNMVSAESSIKV